MEILDSAMLVFGLALVSFAGSIAWLFSIYASFRIADLARDADLLDGVRSAADQMLAEKGSGAEAKCKALIRRWIGSAERFSQA